MYKNLVITVMATPVAAGSIWGAVAPTSAETTVAEGASTARRHRDLASPDWRLIFQPNLGCGAGAAQIPGIDAGVQAMPGPLCPSH